MAHIPIIAKIERRDAYHNLTGITQAADEVMVAQGDLGLDFPIEQVALLQKDIIRCANLQGKPVLTATGMLFSMMKHPKPARAEVADITNAVLGGTDAIMLSGETGVGRYPVQATEMASKIAAWADRYLEYGK